MTNEAARTDRPTPESVFEAGERTFSLIWKFIAAEGVLAIAFARRARG